MKIINFLWKEFIFNGHLQSLGAVGIVYFSFLSLLKTSPSVLLLIIIYILFETIYLFDRFRDYFKDIKTNKERSSHLKNYLGYFPIILASMVIALVLLLLYVNSVNLIFYCGFILIFGLGYPLYFKKVTKYIFMFKNFYVALFHAILLLAPYAYFQISLEVTPQFSLVFIFVYVEALLSQILLDTKDTSADKKAGLKTTSAVFGNDLAINIVLVLSIAIPLVYLLMGIYSRQFLLSLLAGSIFINFGSIYYIKAKRLKGYLIAASKFFIWLLILLGVNIIV